MKTNSQKYKQIIIPEVSTEKWENLSLRDVQKKMAEHYRAKYPNTRTVKNQHLGIKIGFESDGLGKTCRGGSNYPTKNCLVEILDKLIRYAEFNNFGNRKPKDKPNVLGYLNFKAKAKINGKIEHIRLTIRITKRNEGRFTFHYSMSVNIWQ